MKQPNNSVNYSTKRKSKKWLVFVLSTMTLVLAYAAEEALSDDFLDYLTDYADNQGEVLDPADLVVIEDSQKNAEKTAPDSALEHDQESPE